MDRNKVEEIVKKIIVEQSGVDEALITPEADFKQYLGIDDLDMVLIIIQIEHEFGIVIIHSEGFTTVQGIIDYFVSKGICEA